MLVLVLQKEIPVDIMPTCVLMWNTKPLDRDQPVGCHSRPRKHLLKHLIESVPADEVPIKILAIRVGIAQADVSNDIVWVATHTFVSQDCKTDETQADKTYRDANQISSKPE